MTSKCMLKEFHKGKLRNRLLLEKFENENIGNNELKSGEPVPFLKITFIF